MDVFVNLSGMGRLGLGQIPFYDLGGTQRHDAVACLVVVR